MTQFRQWNLHKAKIAPREPSFFAWIKEIFQRMKLNGQTLRVDPHDKYQDWRFDWDRWSGSNNEHGGRRTR